MARKQELNNKKGIPCDIKDLSETEENSKGRNIMFNKEHDSGSNTEQPANNKAYNIANQPCFDGAFADLGGIIFERLVLGFSHDRLWAIMSGD